jgi:glyoxylase I family protein
MSGTAYVVGRGPPRRRPRGGAPANDRLPCGGTEPTPTLERMRLSGIHHVAVICADYAASRRFYTEVLGLAVVAETYRAARDSHKLDLELADGTRIELFTFPGAPPRASYPEARGLRHLAFAVDDVGAAAAELAAQGVAVEPVRVDELTGRRYTFFADPDGLPLELYESDRRAAA